MAQAADLQLRLSGGSGNASPAASIGGAMSSISAPVGLMRDVTALELISGITLYRCVYLLNAGADDLPEGKFWIDSDTTSSDSAIAIGIGTASVSGTEAAIASETTAPSGVTFSEPSDSASGLPTPTLAAGASLSIWARLTVSPSAAMLPVDAWSLRWGISASTLPSLDFSKPSNSMYVWMI